MSTLHVVLPGLAPAGGVVKVLDYVLHARAADFDVRVFTPTRAARDLEVFALPRVAEMIDDPGVVFTTDPTIRLRGDDLALLSLPSQYPTVHAALQPRHSPERVVHLIQGTGHASPASHRGYATRLLTRPMARIATNDVVHRTIAPLVHPRSLLTTIPLGRPRGFFTHEDRGPIGAPIRVGYTTWKSAVGDEVARRLEGRGYTFRAIREHVAWPELRDLYRWSDVFLGTPKREEGFYMPAIEAMEAGAIVVVPDAVGNTAFCVFGENCLRATWEDADSYVAALRDVAAMSPEDRQRMRRAATAALAPFDLDAERAAVGETLRTVGERVRAEEDARRAANAS